MQNLPQARRAPRVDLRAELNRINRGNAMLVAGREADGYVLPADHLGVAYEPGERTLMPRAMFDELVSHERRFGKLSKLSESDRTLSGANVLHEDWWPKCRVCRLPFVCMDNGFAGVGLWVQATEDGGDTCWPCDLAGRFGDDRSGMIEHVVRAGIGDKLMRQFALVGIRKGWDRDRITDNLTPTYWRAPGLFELLRLHRVGMAEASAVIWKMAREIVRAVQTEESEIDVVARRDGWRPMRRAA